MENKIFSQSENFKQEYSCSVVRIGSVVPIEGSDFLGQTFVNGTSIVVRKDQVKEGDILIYAANETQLSEKFLSLNNLYEISEYEKNSNANEVIPYMELISQSKEKIKELKKQLKSAEKKYTKLVKSAESKNENKPTDEELNTAKSTIVNISTEISYHEGVVDETKDKLKSKAGFFNKYGRVKMIRLKGVPSMGFLFNFSELVKSNPEVSDIDKETAVGMYFDTIGETLFVKAYVPPVKKIAQQRADKTNKSNNKIKRFDRMIPGEFKFHYDTRKLSDNIHSLKPNDTVSVSVKLHGTSAIYSKVKTRIPKELPWYKKLVNFICKEGSFLEKYRFIDYRIGYDNVYSSRKVIKNQYINNQVTDGFYKTDVWGEYNEIMKPFIEDGMTVYGEICGYVTDSDKMIQKDYDYGCEVGKNFFMPYRITTNNGCGDFEWNVQEVHDWTVKLMIDNPEIANKLHPIDILYHGKLKDLYPDITVDGYWADNIFHAMSNDVKNFGMENDELMCIHEVPREGVVVRIDNDPMAEAFKLKTYAFFDRERKEIDNGEVDIEMAEEYGSLSEDSGATTDAVVN